MVSKNAVIIAIQKKENQDLRIIIDRLIHPHSKPKVCEATVEVNGLDMMKMLHSASMLLEEATTLNA